MKASDPAGVGYCGGRGCAVRPVLELEPEEEDEDDEGTMSRSAATQSLRCSARLPRRE
jgi:hypothetical protein